MSRARSSSSAPGDRPACALFDGRPGPSAIEPRRVSTFELRPGSPVELSRLRAPGPICRRAPLAPSPSRPLRGLYLPDPRDPSRLPFPPMGRGGSRAPLDSPLPAPVGSPACPFNPSCRDSGSDRKSGPVRFVARVRIRLPVRRHRYFPIKRAAWRTAMIVMLSTISPDSIIWSTSANGKRRTSMNSVSS